MIDSCAPAGASGTSPWSPIATGATASETQSAIDDSADEGVIVSLGGAPGIGDPSTYSPQGLLDSFLQAGTPLADTSSTGPDASGNGSGLASAVQSDDGAVLTAEDGSAAQAATFQSLWGSTLQTNPGMAGTVAADALDQGLVGTLSAIA